MRVGVVDIGTNSMRLLITGADIEEGRWVSVTGLGAGVDATGELAEEPMRRTLTVLTDFGRLMDERDVERRVAVATSATRDAANRNEFLDRAAEALGVRPEVITGEREGALAYLGATLDMVGEPAPTVCDIGGGSTEFVTAATSMSIDIGSVRLTDRMLRERPASERQLGQAREHVLDLFGELAPADELVGVAGTWTSLAAIDLDLPAYDRDLVHHHRIHRSSMEELVVRLAGLTVEETASIPSLDPERAPAMLAGSVIAECALEATGSDSALISDSDSLDGLAVSISGLP